MNENYGLPHVFNSPVDQIGSFKNNASVIYILVPRGVSFYITVDSRYKPTTRDRKKAGLISVVGLYPGGPIKRVDCIIITICIVYIANVLYRESYPKQRIYGITNLNLALTNCSFSSAACSHISLWEIFFIFLKEQFGISSSSEFVWRLIVRCGISVRKDNTAPHFF